MRRFEFVGGTSSKFWQIDQRDRALHASWGRIGTDGRGNVKTFATADKAAKELDKQVRHKLAEGYVETGSKQPTKRRTAKPVKSADVSSLQALCAKSLETLKGSKLVDVKAPKPKPIGLAKLRAWETKEHASLPADYSAFLVAHGTFSVDWRFKTDDGAEYDFGGGHELTVHLPAFNEYRHDPTYPEHNDLAYFATEDDNNHQWAFRLRDGEPVTIVDMDEDPKEFRGSFTDWLTEMSTYFGRKSEFPKSAQKLRAGQLADLAVLAKRMRLTK
jgi:predicted DNA-binding WGR domain protein